MYFLDQNLKSYQKIVSGPIRVRPITSLFEVEFRNYFTEMTTMLRRRVARKIWVPALKVKVTARPCSKVVSGP